ncbi:hypothetical protein HMPREF1988_00384 [Porphyromonas gingivalis F0185]|nr:hypothetical protein HMPREF1988_00384 [Porphyromonas gingivalis F0185]
MVFPPLFSLSKSEDFAHGRDFLELITQMYLIYSEKIPSNQQKDTERSRDCSVSFGRPFGRFFLCGCQTSGKSLLRMLYLR